MRGAFLFSLRTAHYLTSAAADAGVNLCALDAPAIVAAQLKREPVRRTSDNSMQQGQGGQADLRSIDDAGCSGAFGRV